MTAIEINRIAHLKDEESVQKFMKRISGTGTRSRHDNFCVITRPMEDYDWDIIRFWASENGLLAN